MAAKIDTNSTYYIGSIILIPNCSYTTKFNNTITTINQQIYHLLLLDYFNKVHMLCGT